MSRIRTSRFGRGFNPRAINKRNSIVQILDPIRGLHGGLHVEEVPPGFTPQSQNFIVSDGGIQPRSGLSNQGATGLSGPIIGATEVFDTVGQPFGVIADPTDVATLDADTGEWNTLTYTGTDAPSGSSRQYWDSADILDPEIQRDLAVLVNNVNSPKYFIVENNVAQLSDFTFSDDLVSTAKSATAFDNRLIYFNIVNSDNQRFSRRVVWSVRGKPTNWNIADGAGFEDLASMEGEGLMVRPDNAGVLLFSTEEIWRARPRRTAEAFTFQPVSHEVSCPYPRTAVRTPFGVVFLGRDFEVYRISGNNLQALGVRQRGEDSRIQSKIQDEIVEPERAWGIYNERLKRYELYYSVSGSTDGYPTRSLYYDFETDSWFEQRLGAELSLGFEFSQTAEFTGGSAPTWDSVATQWDNMLSTDLWDTFGQVQAADRDLREVLAFSSNGTSYKFSSDMTTDDGTAIDCRWRSHAMKNPDAEPIRRSWVHEIWVERSAPETSNYSLHLSRDAGASFFESRQRSVTSSIHSADHVPTRLGARVPQFELRLDDGGRPNFSRFQVNIAADSRHAGGR